MSPPSHDDLTSLLVPHGSWKWVLGGVALATMLGGLLGLPGSPVWLWQADAHVGNGTIDAAVSLYDGLADDGWTTELQRTGLRRSAALLASDLDRANEAVVRLQRLVLLTPSADSVADLQEQMGRLHRSERDHVAAADAFLLAYRTAPMNGRSAARLRLAARAHMDAGDAIAADLLWEELAESHPSQRAVARLAQAETALSNKDAQAALARYKEAQAAAREPAVRAAARLGLATALERLGNLDGAIAEMDLSQLPGDVRDSRVDRLRARRVERDGE